MRRVLVPAALLVAVMAGGLAVAQTNQDALIAANREADEASARSARLERQAAAATSEAARSRAAAEAMISRIQQSEAEITAAEARVRLIEERQREQRARLAERQGPVVRLTAALQMMARRPPALALIQPGSLDDVVHVRSLLASTLPIIRARTEGLRAEVEAGNRLKRQEARAAAALASDREELRRRRVELARLEERQRSLSTSLSDEALEVSDRALALNEEARELADLMGTRAFQSRLRRELSELPGPALRPALPGERQRRAPPARRERAYILPVQGRLVTGMGEISEGGVHARGLTFEAPAFAAIVAPAAGRVAYAGRFRNYGEIVIIDHGRGWTTLLSNLGAVQVRRGDSVAMGTPVGRASGGEPQVTVELRRNGRPFPITPLV